MNKRFDPGFDSTVLQALIFDVDGTLADTERDLHRVAFNRAFRRAGLDWYWDVPTYGRLLKIAGGKERILHYIQTEAHDTHDTHNLHQSDDSPHSGKHEELTRELHASKTKIYLDLLNKGEVSLRPGVERLLREALRSGFRLAIATTTTPANVVSLLDSTLGDGAHRWFEVIGAGDVVPNKKPAPDIYEYVLRKMRLPAGACFAFEDSSNGLRASTGAGLRTIITPTVYTAGEDFGGAFAVLSDLGEPCWKSRHIAGVPAERGLVDTAQLDAWHRVQREELAL